MKNVSLYDDVYSLAKNLENTLDCESLCKFLFFMTRVLYILFIKKRTVLSNSSEEIFHREIETYPNPLIVVVISRKTFRVNFPNL